VEPGFSKNGSESGVSDVNYQPGFSECS